MAPLKKVVKGKAPKVEQAVEEVTAGKDGAFRMYVSDRYYRMGQMKKFIKTLLWIEIGVVLTRALFHSSLYVLPVNQLPSSFNKVLVPSTLGIIAYSFFALNSRASSDFNKKIGLINVFHMFVAAQLVINFLRYFIAFFETTAEGKAAVQNARVHVTYANYLSETYNVDRALWLERMENVEGLLELSSIIVALGVVGFGNNLFQDMKDQRDETAEKAKQARKELEEQLGGAGLSADAKLLAASEAARAAAEEDEAWEKKKTK